MLISLSATHRKLSLSITAFVGLTLIPCASCKRHTVSSPEPVAEIVDPWKEAVGKVEEDRGEEVGRNATVEVPEQLRNYADRHRFLAVQEADSQASGIAISRDFADLVPLIQRRELVEMKPLGDDYLLYGVGYSASGVPITHYDPATRLDLPLAATEQGLMEEVRQSSGAVKLCAARLADLEGKLLRTPRRDHTGRTTQLKEVARERKALASTKARNKLLAVFCADPARNKALLTEHQLLSDIARDFEGETYDLNDSDARRRFRIRLLSFIRPEARDVLTQIAHEYKVKFDRPLPVSSLVRPVQYQRELASTNVNAARIPTPPHSTGLAFDLYYRYMTAAEQASVMSVIAQLKNEGRVEALRESRDNIHVYVFGDRRRPAEKLVDSVIAREQSRIPSKKSQAGARR